MIDVTNPKDVENRYKLIITAREGDSPGTVVSDAAYTWVDLLEIKGIHTYSSASILEEQYRNTAQFFMKRFGFDRIKGNIYIRNDCGSYTLVDERDLYYYNHVRPENSTVTEAVLMAMRKAAAAHN